VSRRSESRRSVQRRSIGAQLDPQKRAWAHLTWGNGTNVAAALVGFARVPLARCADRGEHVSPKETLLNRMAQGRGKPTKYGSQPRPNMLLAAPRDLTSCVACYIEHDYRDLKQEIGRGIIEGPRWPGFPHPGTLCIAAYGFLISERRENFPPSRTTFPARTSKKSPRSRGIDPEAPPPGAQSHVTTRSPPSAAVVVAIATTLPAMPVLPPPPAAQQRRKFIDKVILIGLTGPPRRWLTHFASLVPAAEGWRSTREREHGAARPPVRFFFFTTSTPMGLP